MPNYTYFCNSCNNEFELFFTIKQYVSQPECSVCQSENTQRHLTKDINSQSFSVKKHNSELKTLGDLAQRNTDKLSDDEKNHLYQKHNSYKDKELEVSLRSGMNRIKKPQKPKWPGAKGKKKRRPNK